MCEFGLEYMTRDHYTGFGMVITMTCHVDALLDRIIVAMTKTAVEPAFYPILTCLTTRDKRDYIVAMAGISTWPPAVVETLTHLMKRTKSAFEVRNSIAHCVWRKGRRSGTIKPMSMSARGALKLLGSEHNEREWSAPELMAEAEKIHQLGTDLAAFMKQYGLLPSLPEKPTTQPPVIPGHKTGKAHRDR